MATDIPETGGQASTLDLSTFARESISKTIQFGWPFRFMNLETSNFHTGFKHFCKREFK